VPRFLLAVVAAGVLAGAADAAQNPFAGLGSLPAGWSHAQINVFYKRQPHTLTFDRGRVQAVTPASLTLHERDGVLVTVPVASTTLVRIDGRPATLAQIRPRMLAVTVSVDGAPAAAVRVQGI
jgi:hypothetical protein